MHGLPVRLFPGAGPAAFCAKGVPSASAGIISKALFFIEKMMHIPS